MRNRSHLEKSGTLGIKVKLGRMIESHLEKSVKLRKIAHTWKKKSHLEKSHTWKNGSPLEKWVTLRKKGSHLEKCVTLEKNGSRVENSSHLEKGSYLGNWSHVEKKGHTQKN